MEITSYFAICSPGAEPVLEQELTALGAINPIPTFGGVAFECSPEIIPRILIKIRTATRILGVIREFAAANAVMLYDQIHRLKWEQVLTADKTFAVHCTIAGAKSLTRKEESDAVDSRRPVIGRSERRDRQDRDNNNNRPARDGLTHSHFVSLKIKDAIVDRLRMKTGARPNVDTKKPDVVVHAFVVQKRCTLSFDLSGESLHERGYRKHATEAPLRETLAASIVDFTGWKPEETFLDPMCGSGTLAIEAALKAYNLAPGLLRAQTRNWGIFHLPQFSRKLWNMELEKCMTEFQIARKNKRNILGYDLHKGSTAAENARSIALEKLIDFRGGDFFKLDVKNLKPGVLVFNPPYGERLQIPNDDDVNFHKEIGNKLKREFTGWRAYVFTGNLPAAKFIGLKPSKKIPLYNGTIECRLLEFKLY